MGVFVEVVDFKEIGAVVEGEDGGDHGQEGADGEYAAYGDDAGQGVLGGGKHEQGNEGFAGAEDENEEEDPGGEAAVFGGFVAVAVLVVAQFPDGPDEVGAAKEEEGPCGPVAPRGFNAFELAQSDPQRYAYAAKDDGAGYVAQSACQGNAYGAGGGPATGFGHGDKWEVVVGPQQGVYGTQGGGGQHQYPQFGTHP